MIEHSHETHKLTQAASTSFVITSDDATRQLERVVRSNVFHAAPRRAHWRAPPPASVASVARQFVIAVVVVVVGAVSVALYRSRLTDAAKHAFLIAFCVSLQRRIRAGKLVTVFPHSHSCVCVRRGACVYPNQCATYYLWVDGM